MFTRVTKFASGRSVIVALLALLSGGALLFNLGPYAALRRLAGGRAIPEEAPSSAAAVHAFLEHVGPEGRETYWRAQWLDLLNPVLLGGFTLLLLGWLLVRARLERGPVRLVLALPLVMAAAELVENVLLASATRAFPGSAWGTGFVSVATRLKLGSFVLALLGALALAVAAVARGRRGSAAR
jgi:hypothetical protein